MNRRPQQAGFTMVELVVTLAILAVVTVQSLSVMSTQEHNYYAQKRAIEAQADARLIADMVMRDVRSSGFLVPAIVGISSRDGGTAAADATGAAQPAARPWAQGQTRPLASRRLIRRTLERKRARAIEHADRVHERLERTAELPARGISVVRV